MAKYEIRTHGDPILKQKAVKIDKFNTEIKEIFGNMLETMYANNGLGLAANQVGIKKKMFVIDTGTPEKPRVFRLANPEIISRSKETSVFEEGCLSFPGITENITRPAKITVRAQDENGKEVTIEAEGLNATAFQHEIDHLNGIVFIDRMTPVKRMMHSKKLKELKNMRKKEKI